MSRSNEMPPCLGMPAPCAECEVCTARVSCYRAQFDLSELVLLPYFDVPENPTTEHERVQLKIVRAMKQ